MVITAWSTMILEIIKMIQITPENQMVILTKNISKNMRIFPGTTILQKKERKIQQKTKN